MKPVPPEAHRVTAAVCRRFGWPLQLASTASSGMTGMFVLPNPYGAKLPSRNFDGLIRCVAHDGVGVSIAGGDGWEHVSASFDHRCPTWEEMCLVKAAFWCEDETVVQYHPAAADYVNRHPYALHLWRHPSMPTPPKGLV